MLGSMGGAARSGSSRIPSRGSVEQNRKLVLDFYENVIIDRQFHRWPEYLRPDYIQHKPNLADGPLGVIEFMQENYARYPEHAPKVLRSFVDGDYVFLHVQVQMRHGNGMF